MPLSCTRLHQLVELLCPIVPDGTLLEFAGGSGHVQLLLGGNEGCDPWRRLSAIMELLADDLAAPNSQQVALFEAAPFPPLLGVTQLLRPY